MLLSDTPHPPQPHHQLPGQVLYPKHKTAIIWPHLILLGPHLLPFLLKSDVSATLNLLGNLCVCVCVCVSACTRAGQGMDNVGRSQLTLLEASKCISL